MMNSAYGRLRPATDDDLTIMRTWRNTPSVREKMYTWHEISEDEHHQWWERTKSTNVHRYFIYEFRNTPVGVVSFNNIDERNQNASWAFYASPDAERGTGSRMEILALDYAFFDLRLHKLSCEVLEFNTSVIKLHKKFGFVEEGILRQQYQRDGKFYDIHRLGVLATEWVDKRNDMLASIPVSRGE
ncbi:UDP-4-amino-4,6-dideoxy-N-acetyl-beta-L-altrosamine N-acetyltransferase [Sinorhizobium sp. BJ1]|uniref:UDP-4-amino-4, 6-dideoxy-N-acetyl-beta-L-altrosamine N-acetyltransferase n=1 Tax=Sinorhizobium sp. BJ1 TaxID=2035455 RepID=UPI000BEA6EBF|nr:UDP-4-amino-4,6-dideoxy-N-acetyl-beta-L-altrosamine N-acetyltransferase [Sinorhizobium sp. BJ1]PDT81736.1 UDP-4-amino-4,6-dideoxy-N-acetyl-beta-L-altrosamine N-acetyltransferase [Sinorhizobium sp. BJ1]